MSCFESMVPSEKDWDWRQCGQCKLISHSLKAILFIGILIISIALYRKNQFSNGVLNFYSLGYVLDIVGGWFLAHGLADLFALSASSFGGGSETFKKYGRRNFYYRSIGLLLLTLGFLIQCISNIHLYNPLQG
jgi:hypothetical protein